ncbi:MAG TPA: hypothetical protein VI916_06395 [Acidimicrobiia bacterium]|nr:hypothetical protein [Acidimicrobiia bacterium]
MTRFVQRTLAPLLAGALAAGFVVAVADASDVLRFSGELAQSEADATPDSTTPLEELDLDKLVEQPSKFDFESVKVDLGPVGDYFGLYEWSDESVDPADVAADLELMVPDAVDPDGEGPVVTGGHAAETYLLSDDCNPLMALPIRKQAKYTVRARIMRPDLAGIAAATPADPGSAAALAVETDPVGISHVLPLTSVVDIATVTVSEIDLDLIRAHPARLLNDLVADDPNLAENAPPGSSPDTFGTTEFFGAAWLSCLIAAAEEGTAPVPQTVNGHLAFGLLQDHPDHDPVDATVPEIDTVAWVEEGLEFRVESTFLNVSDELSIDYSVDLDTRTWLQHFADSVEPALDISGRLISRAADPLELLFSEAFSAPPGLEFGDDIHGTSDAVSTSVRNAETPPFVQSLEQAASGAAAAPAAPAPPANGTADLGSADQILGARARGVLPEGASVLNVRRRRSDPPNGFGVTPEIATQVVAWAPDFLNSDPFREGWKKGFKRVDPGAVTLDELHVLGDGFAEVEAELETLDVVDLVFSNAEGTFRIDYLTPCYSVTVSALDSEGLLDFTVRLAREQKAARDAVFGQVSPPLVAPIDARPPGDPFSPSLEDLDRDYILGALKANAARLAKHAEQSRAERAKQDARRTALCGAPNLASHLSGFTVTDADGNGVDDELADNDVAKAGATEPTTDAAPPATTPTTAPS